MTVLPTAEAVGYGENLSILLTRYVSRPPLSEGPFTPTSNPCFRRDRSLTVAALFFLFLYLYKSEDGGIEEGDECFSLAKIYCSGYDLTRSG